MDVDQRLGEVDLSSEIETPIELVHKTYTKELFLDLVVSLKAVYELKVVSTLNSNHVAQLLTYLYLLDLPRGKLVNFRSPTVGSQFVNAPIPRAERCGFSVSENDYHGQLLSLLELSPLRTIHWINIGPHCVAFRTVERR